MSNNGKLPVSRNWWVRISNLDWPGILSFIVIGIALVATSIWEIEVYRQENSLAADFPEAVAAESGGVAADGNSADSTARDGVAVAVVGSANAVATGIALEQHDADLAARKQEIQKERVEAN